MLGTDGHSVVADDASHIGFFAQVDAPPAAAIREPKKAWQGKSAISIGVS
jgi:hypothetical protein